MKVKLRRFQSEGTWDRLAAGQQLVLLRALYAEREAGARALLATDAQLVAWEEIEDYSWPPSWCVIRDGNRWFITLAGTTNLRQMGGHLLGTIAVADGPGPIPSIEGNVIEGRPNGAWAALWDTLWPDIRAKLPDDLAGHQVHLSGHSYGGALAQLFASRLMRAESADVQVMTFGQPRVWTKGYKGPIPEVCYLLASPYDPVFASPPSYNAVWVGQLYGDVGLGGIDVVRWQHYGEIVYLRADGADSPVKEQFEPTLPEDWVRAFRAGENGPFRETDFGVANEDYRHAELVKYGLLNEHNTANYMGRVAQSYYRRAGG